MKIFKKFYFWLPVGSTILSIYILAGNGKGLVIVAFPFIYILDAVGMLFSFGAFNIIAYTVSGIIFYFLIGLFIDKIISKLRKSNI